MGNLVFTPFLGCRGGRISDPFGCLGLFLLAVLLVLTRLTEYLCTLWPGTLLLLRPDPFATQRRNKCGSWTYGVSATCPVH